MPIDAFVEFFGNAVKTDIFTVNDDEHASNFAQSTSAGNRAFDVVQFGAISAIQGSISG